MKNDFALALNEVLEDRGLPKNIVVEANEAAMVSAYRRSVNASNAQHIEAKVNPDNGKVIIYSEKEVVDSVQDERTEVTLVAAKTVDPQAEMGDMVVVESTPKNFGRVAAQTARQVIQQRIREAERESQFNYYEKQVGEIVNGVVQAINAKGINLGLELKAEGLMPRNQQIPREFFRVHDRIRALLLEIKMSPRGPQIILSRAHRDFLRRLLENEVPEIYHGMVEIRSISREPGYRSKVAVAALQPGVDPVGACVGIRGVRIQTIVRELNDEKIDVIEWNPDPAIYIAKGLSPARVIGVYLDENRAGPKTATVVVPEDQLSLAIGRDGQNARLAAKLTGWRIDIKSLPEAASEVMFKLQNNPEYKIFNTQEADTISHIEATLGKKADGRPITPEEYHMMGSFVDRVEQGVVQRRQAIKEEHELRLKTAQDAVPNAVYDLPIFALGLTKKVTAALEEQEYENIGDLMVQFFFDPSKLKEFEAINDKALESIRNAFDLLTSTLPEPEPVPEVETEAEPVSEAEPVLAVDQVELVESQEETPTGEPVVEAEIEFKEAEIAQPEAEEDEALPASLEEIFKLKPEMLDAPEENGIAIEDDSDSKEKKKKRKKYVDVEYDPEQDVTIYRKKRKRGGGEVDDFDDDWSSNQQA
ncbi:MAG: transcription termination factor NusA [Anaerolineales bacterium]|nr:transcription termination factor NusA [Anaerolineales bacterium]